MLLLVAGNETTTNLIGNAILCLDEHPADLQRLRTHRELVPGALEEVLRYFSPLKLAPRWAASETTIGDQRIEAGQMLFAWVASANRDETQFSAADQFQIEREPNRHLAFGRGIHFCLGAPLARLEARIALNTMLDRLPGLKILPSMCLPKKSDACLSATAPITRQTRWMCLTMRPAAHGTPGHCLNRVVADWSRRSMTTLPSAA